MNDLDKILAELKDLKRLRTNEILMYKNKVEYLSMFKQETKTSRILAWVLPLVMFIGSGFGIYFFMQSMVLPCGG